MLHVVNDIVNTEKKRQKDLTILTKISFYLNIRTQVYFDLVLPSKTTETKINSEHKHTNNNNAN